MDLAVPILLGVVCVISITVLSRRVRVAAPLLLVLVGVIVSFLPFVGTVEVDPELILAGVLPPLLFASAVSMPATGFRRNFKTIGGLSILLVIATSLIVGFLIVRVIPGINLATAIALAAIVSPTDAVATSIVKRVGVPARLIAILDGESLLNDASALVILRSAVAAMAVSISLGRVALEFVWAVVAAVVIGAVVGQISLRLAGRLRDPVLSTAASFIVPFVAYFPAERVGASGLVAAVVAGIVIGIGAPSYLAPLERRTEESNWRTVEFLLEGAVFLIMGLELSGLISDVRDEHGSLQSALWYGAIVFVAVLAVRALYLAPLLFGLKHEHDKLDDERTNLQDARARLEDDDRYLDRKWLRHTLRDDSSKQQPRLARRLRMPTSEELEAQRHRVRQMLDMRIADVDYFAAEPIGVREGIVLVWAGMRGVVTLAAAQSLPADTPQRSLLVLIAFIVAAGSLLIQGGTLPWVVKWLGLSSGANSPQSVAERRELVSVLSSTSSALCDPPDLSRADGTAYDANAFRLACNDSLRGADFIADPTASYEDYLEVRIRLIHAQRNALLDLRFQGAYSSQLFEDALAILDSDEIALSLRGGIDSTDE